jgi:hypothetical protein
MRLAALALSAALSLAVIPLPTILAPVDHDHDEEDFYLPPKKRDRGKKAPSQRELDTQREIEEHRRDLHDLQRQIDELRKRQFMPGERPKGVPKERKENKLESPFKMLKDRLHLP